MRLTTTLSIAALSAALALPAAVQAQTKKETGPSSKSSGQVESKSSQQYWWNDPSQYSTYEGSSMGAASGTAGMSDPDVDGIGVDKDDPTTQGNLDNEGASTGAAAGASGAGASGAGDPDTDGIGVDPKDESEQDNSSNQ